MGAHSLLGCAPSAGRGQAGIARHLPRQPVLEGAGPSPACKKHKYTYILFCNTEKGAQQEQGNKAPTKQQKGSQ